MFGFEATSTLVGLEKKLERFSNSGDSIELIGSERSSLIDQALVINKETVFGNDRDIVPKQR